MKIAAALICKGSNAEAIVLDRALENIRPFVDGIFVTRTHLPGEALNHKVGEVVAAHGGTLSDFEWCHDFSAARNYNFSQVSKTYDYIIWMDADDVYRGLEKLRPTIEANPNVDAFGLWYLYGWDEHKKPVIVHRKTMIVKNDGCVKWGGAIHEDLQETRQLNVKLIDGIDRMHLSDDVRYEESKERNLDISKRALEDNPDDPHSLWNLANAYFGAGEYEKSRQAFEQFIEDSGSDAEKYIAHQRLSDICKVTGDNRGAVRHLQIDIGIMPSLPDAYLHLAQTYFFIGDMDKAEAYSLQGLMRRPKPHAMIVYNPRDYDYHPMMLLARIYSHKNRPDLMLPLLKGCAGIYPKDKALKDMVKQGEKEKKILGKALEQIQKLQKIRGKEKLKAAIDALPDELRSHPAVAVLRNKHFTKTTSSGKDMVIYCGFTGHVWSPDTFKKEGIGGSEEAVIHLAREYAKLGWNVTVYNNCGNKEVKDGKVVFKPYWEFNHNDKQDVAIIWRTPKPVDADINAPKIFIDMHDVLPPGEFTDARLAKITRVMFKSQAHRDLYPNVSASKCAIVQNGFEPYEAAEKKDPYLIINTSSPDRSLDVLPALFKRVKERVPKAKMAWAYGWEIYKKAFSGNEKKIAWMDEINASMKEAGIENLGRLTQAEVGKLYHKAAIFAYPTEFFEISCISVLKAQAARCVPVTTDFAALKESNVFGVQVHSPKTAQNWTRPYQKAFGLEDKDAQDAWVEAVVKELEKPTKIDQDELDVWTESYAWPSIASRWTDYF